MGWRGFPVTATEHAMSANGADTQPPAEPSPQSRLAERQRLLERDILAGPHDPALFCALAEVLYRQGRWPEARHRYEQALALDERNARAHFGVGVSAMRTDHQRLSLAALAATHFRRAVELDPAMHEAHYHLGIVTGVQAQHIDAIEHFQATLALKPDHVAAHYELSKALYLADRVDAARAHLIETLNLDPGHSGARRDLAALDALCEQPPRTARFRRYPSKIADLADLDEVIRRHILPERDSYPKILRPDARVATFGSCFAGNLAHALRKLGVTAENTTFGESINSTAANRYYIDWVAGNGDNVVTRAIAEHHRNDPNFSADPACHRQRILQSDLVVLTLGVAPCFFARDTGELVIPDTSMIGVRALLGRCDFRTTSTDENRANILHIIAAIRGINPRANIVLTVSPVPLNATFEMESAVVADCVSKATLRVAVEDVLRQGVPGVRYFPSFEIVRWLSAYLPGMYGEDDGSTVHVSERVVDAIVRAFLDAYGEGFA